MANDDYPWDPPVAGTEAEALVGALDRLRTTFRWKADDLDAAGLQTRIPSSPLTLGSLLKHLSRAEDEIFTVKLSGAPRSAPWDTAPWDADPDWDFTSAPGDSLSDLVALYQAACERSRAVTAAHQLDDIGVRTDRGEFSLRWVLVHLLEETARHLGHLDILVEQLEGRTGE